MSWSLVLNAVIDFSYDEAENVRRKEARAASRVREESLERGKAEGSILAADLSGEQESLDLESSKAFAKLWADISVWRSQLLNDAVEYANAHAPRISSAVENTSMIPEATKSRFDQELWSSLSNRGWRFDNTKLSYAYEKQTVRSMCTLRQY